MTDCKTRDYEFLNELDENQKKAVKSDINSVISAGAGSGKTKVLATRFLYLIVEKKLPVESILTVTFTQKAATEMYSRIYDSLSKSNFPEAQKAVENFHKAQISTIDSFCTKIARKTSKFFGIAPDFVLEDDISQSKAQELALPFLLENRNTEGVKLLLKNTTVTDLSKNLFDSFFSKKIAITRPVDFVSTFNNQVKGLNEVWNIAIKKTKEFIETLKTLNTDKKKSETEIVEAAKKITIFPKLFLNELQDSNDYIKTELSPDLETFISQLHDLSKFRKISSSTKSETGIIIREIQDAIKNKTTLGLNNEITFTNGLYLECETMFMAAYVLEQNIEVFKILDKFQKLYIQEKINSKKLSFNDVATMAVDGLLIDKTLRNSLKNNFKSIMIDEFQDDNQLQRDLLFLLAEKPSLSSDCIPEAKDLVSDKLFFVGDEKQSIYRFRGADVSVFRNLTKTLLKNSSTEMPRLEINYRTQPKILKFFNSVFPHIFQMEKQKKEFEADFFPILTPSQKPSEDNKNDIIDFIPNIEIINIPKDNEEDESITNKEKEALCIASKILDFIEQKTLIWDKEKKINRPCQFSDFALLFRATTNQNYYESALKKFNIPYVAENQKSLFEDSVVIDILNFLKLAVYSQDRMAYAIVLRSPLVRISDNGFLTIMEYTLNEKGYTDTRISWEPFIFEKEQLLSENDNTALKEARNLYLNLQSKIDRVPISDLISYLWYNCGYRYNVIVKESLQPYQELYDFFYFLGLQADKNNLQLTDFLTSILNQINENSNMQNLSIPRENQNGVKLLTIHKSKGLEFPIVFLVNCSSQLRNICNNEPYYISSKWGLSVNIEKTKGKQNWFYISGQAEEKEKEIAEQRRLLYVAATRAESHLVFFTEENLEKDTPNLFLIEGNKDGKEKAETNSFSSYLSNALKKINQNNSPENFQNEENKKNDITEFKIDFCENLLQLSSKSYLPKESEQTEKETNILFVEENYNSANLREPQFIKAQKLNPSYFKEESEKAKYTYPSEIDNEEIELLSDANLEPTDFGTLTHLCIQNKIEKQKFEIPDNYKKKFSSIQKINKLKEKIENLSENFFNSEFAKFLNETEFTYCEFPFMTKYKTDIDHVFSGTMDLVFLPKNSDNIILVDFKTDKVQLPEIHKTQMKIYKKATSEIWEKPVKAYLFYLRTGKEVEM